MHIRSDFMLKSSSDEELVEILDAKGNTVTALPVAEARAQSLCYKAVITLFYNCKRQLYIQKRSNYCPVYPLLWQASAFSHVRMGESGEEAALRSLYESMKIKATRCTLIYSSLCEKNMSGINVDRLSLEVYIALAPRLNPAPDSKEIDSLIAVDKDELAALLQSYKGELAPPLAFVAEKGLVFS